MKNAKTITSFQPADFTPDYIEPVTLTPFRFFCQKVLPTVYDDSLSYYELLCKLVESINTIIKNNDTIQENVINLQKAFVLLQQYVNDYFKNLDVQKEINIKLDEMANDGSLKKIIESTYGSRLNLNTLSNGNLTSENFSETLKKALSITKFIYIPSNFNYSHGKKNTILIEEDCDILCGNNVVFNNTDNENKGCIFEFRNCDVEFNGGECNLRKENNTFVEDKQYGIVTCGFISAESCNLTLRNIKCTYSTFGSVIRVKNCKNVNIGYVETGTTLLSSIYLIHSCDKFYVHDCVFNDCRLPKNDIKYCYACATGGVDLTTQYTIPKLVIYENNTVKSSEDSGLDSHGAETIIFRNNTVLNSVCSLTGYLDSNRRNLSGDLNSLLVENNYCKSDKSVNPAKHPSLLFSNSDKKSRRVKNIIIRNNYFDSKINDSEYGNVLLPLNRITNLIIENNFFVGNNSINNSVSIYSVENVTIRNNYFSKFIKSCCLVSGSCKGEFLNNCGSSNYVYLDKTGCSYIKTDYNLSSKMMLNSFEVEPTTLKMNKSQYLALVTENTKFNINCTLTDSTLTTTDNSEIPYCINQALDIGGKTFYVDSINSDYSVNIWGNNKLPNGTYQVKPKLAEMVDIINV